MKRKVSVEAKISTNFVQFNIHRYEVSLIDMNHREHEPWTMFLTRAS
jgi:hypothetical protein